MGQSADQKVSEIHRTRVQLEEDLRELDRRLPVPLDGKTAGLLLGGSTVGGLVLKAVTRARRKRKERRARTAEVVVRVVDERDGSR